MMHLDYTRAEALYASQDLGQEIGLGERPALLVVDFQLGFTDPASPIGGDMSAAIEATVDLLAAARTADVPVWYTVVGYRPDLADAGVWPLKYPRLDALRRNTPAVQVDPRVAPSDAEVVILKQYASAFFGTSLHSMLAAARVDSLIVTGCTTSGCVRATVVDGMQYGYRVVVAEDCCADRDEAPHLANLFDMRTKYADVAPSGQIIKSLELRSGQPSRT
ncbi:isochorismatase family protein [Micromonospora sicca]|nr:isochorismatase family protein [Micromonospora sp. 4G51]